MKVWQGCLLAFGAFVLLIAAIVGVVFYATSGIVDTADEFFEAASEGDYSTAYGLTSQQLQSTLTEEQLEAFAVDYGLDAVSDTSWNSRNINNDRGELVGTLTTAGGGTIPVEIDLVYEGEEWKISFINVDASGASATGGGGSASASSPEPMVLPSASDQEDLLFFAGTGFVNALQDGSWDSWQSRFIDEISAEDLEANFASFADSEPALRRAIAQGAEFEPATQLNDNGQLELSGTYGGRLRFRYIFTGEGDADPKISFVDYELE